MVRRVNPFMAIVAAAEAIIRLVAGLDRDGEQLYTFTCKSCGICQFRTLREAGVAGWARVKSIGWMCPGCLK